MVCKWVERSGSGRNKEVVVWIPGEGGLHEEEEELGRVEVGGGELWGEGLLDGVRVDDEVYWCGWMGYLCVGR